MGRYVLGVIFLLILLTACAPASYASIVQSPRYDGARILPISSEGSFQNPAWSPDGQSVLLTRFRNGYNQDPADLLVIDLVGNSERILVSDGSGNINLPGSIWNEKTGQVVFSSTRDPHDEIFVIVGSGSPGEELKITSRSELVAYEPSLSPDGQWVVFESHPIDVDNNGMIVKYAIDGTSQYETLSEAGKDSRQPNWAPAGDLIVFQVFVHG